ncbi:uncharacterized protein [Cherax quadricarinatus]|uniref:uncharacterized protein n=1 Tax=Cherax quadricarinatus TaxID=27406 RepID=UPI00387E8662
MSAASLLLLLLLLTATAEVNPVTSLSYTYRKKDCVYAEGSILLSMKVGSNIECSASCVPPACVGYNIAQNGTEMLCTIFSNVTNYTADANTRYYCSDCRYLGEECSSDAQCTDMTMYSLCNVECVCPTGYINTNATCQFDYKAAGFTTYRGRWVYIKDYSLSWNGALDACKSLHATMFIPWDATDWNWMSSKVSLITLGAYFPINDIAQEGVSMWNNGTAVKNAPFLVWSIVNLNNALLDCVMMAVTYSPTKSTSILYGSCINIFTHSLFCEAPM